MERHNSANAFQMCAPLKEIDKDSVELQQPIRQLTKRGRTDFVVRAMEQRTGRTFKRHKQPHLVHPQGANEVRKLSNQFFAGLKLLFYAIDVFEVPIAGAIKPAAAKEPVGARLSPKMIVASSA